MRHCYHRSIQWWITAMCNKGAFEVLVSANKLKSASEVTIEAISRVNEQGIFSHQNTRHLSIRTKNIKINNSLFTGGCRATTQRLPTGWRKRWCLFFFRAVLYLKIFRSNFWVCDKLSVVVTVVHRLRLTQRVRMTVSLISLLPTTYIERIHHMIRTSLAAVSLKSKGHI